MMPIREGASEKVFYSDKTFLTVHVDGQMNGQTQRRVLEDELLVTPEGKRGSLPWKKDFNGQDSRFGIKALSEELRKGLLKTRMASLCLKL